MQYKVIDDIRQADRVRWNELIENHPSKTIFQSPDFSDLYRDDDYYTPVFIGVTDDSGKYLAMIFAIMMNEYSRLKRSFALRTVVYGGPIIDHGSNDQEIILGLLLEALVMKANSSVYIEFRNFTDLSCFKGIFANYGFRFREHLNLIVNTHDFKEVQSISKSKLRQVRKSLDAGAEIRQAGSIEEFEEFYTLLKNLYRKKVRKPLPSIEFFRNFFDESQKGRLGVILVVKYNGRVVAGMVCPVTPGKAVHEWYVCGADQDYKEIYPSVLITWGGIHYAIDHHLPMFDFMGAGEPGQEYGVRDFKTRFGGEQVNYGRFIRVNRRLSYFIGRLGFYILTHIVFHSRPTSRS